MTYTEMATALDVERCRGRTPTGHYCNEQHEKEGSITDHPGPRGRVIHFSERPVTRLNTHLFLRLVARVKDPSLDMDEAWRRVYRLHMAERRLARSLGIKEPWGGVHARADRAFVLASVAPLSNSVPMRKQAFDWARRGPKRKETVDA